MRTVLSIALLFMLLSVVNAADTNQAPIVSVDLATEQGISIVKGNWRYQDVDLITTQHHAADKQGQPTGEKVASWDIQPHAGLREFDDSSWSVIQPNTLNQRRGNGRVSFAWYRINITIPDRVNDVDTRGSTVVFETSIDDYAEIWVDGELPRATGQSGGSVIGGWNVTNQLVIARNAKPGQKIQLAVFGVNGPISDPPANFIWMRLAKLQFFAAGTTSAEPIAVVPQEVNVRVARLDDSINAIVPANAKIFKLAEGFQFTEGPIWLHNQQKLLFSDPNANRIYVYDAKNASLSVFREHSGYEGADVAEYGQPGSNGLTLDKQGRLTINQHGNRRVVRLEKDGSLTVLADRYQGKRLNSPNDLVYKSDSAIYFTDPPFGLPKFFADPHKELNFSGVYRALNGKVALLSKELTGPNGIAFSPDEHYLYVGNWDPARKVVLRYPVKRDGTLGKSEVFADMTTELPGDEALDGMKVDTRGNLYVTAPDGVRIYAPSGKHLGTITAPRTVHNIAWGDGSSGEGHSLYMCAHDRLYRIDLLVEGVRP